MKKNWFYIIILAAASACSPSDKDLSRPRILPIGDYASPLNCQEFTRGGILPFAYAFSDDVELGAFNLEVHNNFDHHSHSTEAEDCGHEEHKTPVNPWVFNKDYPIPEGLSYYEASFNIPIPEDIDTGVYHFMIRVTDSAGWQQLRSVSIKIVEADA